MKYIIETPRLRLREMEASDAPFMFELNSDPEVLRYVPDSAFADLDAALAIVRYVQRQYAEHGMGRLVVELRDTGEPLGWCGLKNIPELGEIDLGYRFMRRHWGKGYASEAGEACVRWGFEVLDIERIVGRAYPENTASVRVLEKLGLRHIGLREEDGAMLAVLEILRSDYLISQKSRP